MPRSYLKTLLALLLLLCFGSSCALPRHSEITTQTLASPASFGIDRFAVVDQARAHYVEAGTGPPAILIPGLFGTYRGFSRMLPLLAPHFHLYALDNFGTGESERPSDAFTYTVEEQADMIVKLMDELKLERSTFIGVSYGGMIALNLAARYPERVQAVVCIEGAVIMPKPSPYHSMEKGLDTSILGNAIIGLIRSGLLDRTITKDVMGWSWPHLNDEDRAEVTEIVSHYTDAATRPTWLGLARALRLTRDFTEEAKNIRAPVLYLYGEKTSFARMINTNIEFFQEHLPHVELVFLSDGIHDLELQKPVETTAVILEFLAPERLEALARSGDDEQRANQPTYQ
jgi:pimeloyl-ACP methyl ester carboxylesterase